MRDEGHVYFYGNDKRALKAAFKMAHERLFHSLGRLPTAVEVAREMGATINVKSRPGQPDRWEVHPLDSR